MEILAITISIVICCFLGLATGFSQMAHIDVKKGLKPVTENKLITLIAKPTKEYKGIQILIFIVIMLLWLIIFFGSLIACGILISKYAPNFLGQLYYLFPFFFVGLFVGTKAWQKIPKTKT